MTYTNEADFSVGYQMTRYYTLSHTVLPFLALKLISGDRSHISRDANNELLNTCKIPIITQYDDRNLEVMGNYELSIKRLHIPVHTIV